MEVWRTRADLAGLSALRKRGPVVLVPTMGALHAGHLHLVEIGRRHGPVVVSIFVNPTQFAPNEDYDSYPRDLEQDLQALRPLGVSAVFVPTVQQMYPAGAGVMIQPGRRAAPLCGAARPGHFSGVLTVVAKLFLLVRPDYAVFGAKDAQQCLVIGEMVRDLRFAVRIIEGPTVRESDGLALSSRNRFLASEQRRRAVCLHCSLQTARGLIERGERSAGAVEAALREELQPADAIEYAEVRSLPDLESLESLAGRVLIAVAARIGPVRLIDNLALAIDGSDVRTCRLLESGEPA